VINTRAVMGERMMCHVYYFAVLVSVFFLSLRKNHFSTEQFVSNRYFLPSNRISQKT
jgi:hypothetical protein